MIQRYKRRVLLGMFAGRRRERVLLRRNGLRLISSDKGKEVWALKDKDQCYVKKR